MEIMHLFKSTKGETNFVLSNTEQPSLRRPSLPILASHSHLGRFCWRCGRGVLLRADVHRMVSAPAIPVFIIPLSCSKLHPLVPQCSHLGFNIAFTSLAPMTISTAGHPNSCQFHDIWLEWCWLKNRPLSHNYPTDIDGAWPWKATQRAITRSKVVILIACWQNFSTSWSVVDGILCIATLQ
jgi:hypothetical protein